MKPKVKKLESNIDFYEMCNYGAEQTGLAVLVWTGLNVKGRKPRILVQRTYAKKMDPKNLFSVSISDTPKILAGDQGEIKDADLKKIFKWIVLNQQALLDLWNINVDSFKDFEALIKKV